MPLLQTPATPPPTSRTQIAHVARAIVCVSGSLLVADALGLANGYWAPMTALLVLKPRLHDTQARGLARVAGTLAGCVAATAFALAVHDSPVIEVIGLTIAATAAFTLQKATYAVFSGALTAAVVLLVSLGQTSVVDNAEHRILATLLGGALALLAARIGPDDVRSSAAQDRVA